MPVFNRRHPTSDQFVDAGFASIGQALNVLSTQALRAPAQVCSLIVGWAEQLEWLSAAHERHRAYAARFCKRWRGHLTSEAVWLSLGLRAS